MTVASKDLCTELYELSGWKTDYFFTEEVNGADSDYGLIRYDLSYLLRKLDGKYLELVHSFELTGGDNQMVVSDSWKASYFVGVDEYGGYQSEDENPEDAVCKLAIELFKQGVLNHV